MSRDWHDLVWCTVMAACFLGGLTLLTLAEKKTPAAPLELGPTRACAAVCAHLSDCAGCAPSCSRLERSGYLQPDLNCLHQAADCAAAGACRELAGDGGAP